MDVFGSVLVALAGFAAGTINTIVGSGTLVTFPVLIALGVVPVTASISNAMGLVAGGFSGVWGYRRELRGQGAVIARLLPASILGAIVGSSLLLHLPAGVFTYVAPVLIVVAITSVIVQPKLQIWLKKRRAATASLEYGRSESPTRDARREPGWQLILLVFLVGIYGGYFVAAQGILLIGILGIFLSGTLQQANAIKIVLTTLVNVVAALSYLIFAFDRINWQVVLIIAVSSLVGGALGAKIGLKLSPFWLRMIVVALGILALVNMLFKIFAQS